MRIRFRLGPFTFGRSGTRLSLWKRGTGVSIPVSGKKKRSFGKVKLGPFSLFFGGSRKAKLDKQGKQQKNDHTESCDFKQFIPGITNRYGIHPISSLFDDETL